MQKFIVVKGNSAAGAIKDSANAAAAAAVSAAGSSSESTAKTMPITVSSNDGNVMSKVERPVVGNNNQPKEDDATKLVKASSATPALQVKMSGYLKKKRKVCNLICFPMSIHCRLVCKATFNTKIYF